MNNLVLAYDPVGRYGPCVKLCRGKRFIMYTVWSWQKIREQIPLFKTPDYSFKVSEGKEVNVVSFGGRQYVSFHYIYKREGEVADIYINLSEEEWAKLLECLDHVDSVIPPKKIKACPDCSVIKKVVPVVGGRMLESLMMADAVQHIHENNSYAQSDEECLCEYCGGQQFGAGCHCHQHNCRKCEPDNFCGTCGTLTVFAV